MKLLLILLAAGLLTGCGPKIIERADPPDDLDPVAAAIRDLSGARTRIVWLRDIGDGTDYLARGTQLQLMGFDTDDGRGERIILPANRNITKPMFTVDGERIVFSDRHAGTMHIVDWEGGEPETLGDGFVLHSWRDPKTGIEWLYYAKDLVDDGKLLPTHEAIYRKALPPYPHNLQTLAARLRGRLSEQRVWSQSHVSEDSYQLSADGRFASAAFPWPEVGVHDVKAQRWHRHGRGCWVAMSPDNTYMLWILDGPHRNLTMERIGDPEAGGRWTVPINQLPDTDRYEVYHPRWSNHPRIMAVTGPYKVGDGGYRLPGGGADVEIWLGRFAEDHRTIEHWVRATYNNHANFYPDVWVERDPNAHLDAPVAVPALTGEHIGWPSDTAGLSYLWKHGGAQNEIVRSETGQRSIFRPEARRLARFGGRHEMWLDGGFFVDEEAPTLSAPFSMELAIVPPRDAGAHSFIFGHDPDLALLEVDGLWLLRWAGTDIPLGPAARDGLSHLVVNVTSRKVQSYLNGQLHAEQALDEPLPPTTGPLYFGGHPDAPGNWAGRLSHIAVYERVLTERETIRNHRLAREDAERRPVAEPERVRARAVSQSAIPAPADIAPYRRALVVNEYEIIEGDRTGERLLAAHWAILGGGVLDTADRPVDSEHTLSLVLFDERPELEGERVAMDSEDFTLELWYDLNL